MKKTTVSREARMDVIGDTFAGIACRVRGLSEICHLLGDTERDTKYLEERGAILAVGSMLRVFERQILETARLIEVYGVAPDMYFGIDTPQNWEEETGEEFHVVPVVAVESEGMRRARHVYDRAVPRRWEVDRGREQVNKELDAQARGAMLLGDAAPVAGSLAERMEESARWPLVQSLEGIRCRMEGFGSLFSAIAGDSAGGTPLQQAMNSLWAETESFCREIDEASRLIADNGVAPDMIFGLDASDEWRRRTGRELHYEPMESDDACSAREAEERKEAWKAAREGQDENIPVEKVNGPTPEEEKAREVVLVKKELLEIVGSRAMVEASDLAPEEKARRLRNLRIAEARCKISIDGKPNAAERFATAMDAIQAEGFAPEPSVPSRAAKVTPPTGPKPVKTKAKAAKGATRARKVA